VTVENSIRLNWLLGQIRNATSGSAIEVLKLNIAVRAVMTRLTEEERAEVDAATKKRLSELKAGKAA